MPPSPRTRRRKPTIAAGAVIERELIRRYLQRRLLKIRRACLGPATPGTRQAHEYRVLLTTLNWLNAQPERTATPGGIGR
jgi:hypothetical protein